MNSIFSARFVWYRGAEVVAGLLLATLAGMNQLAGIFGVVGVWVVFGMGQLFEGSVVTPSLVGDRVELHPVAVIFALPVSGHLSGFLGVLLTLPASAALLVGLRHLRAQHPGSDLYKS